MPGIEKVSVQSLVAPEDVIVRKYSEAPECAKAILHCILMGLCGYRVVICALRLHTESMPDAVLPDRLTDEHIALRMLARSRSAAGTSSFARPRGHSMDDDPGRPR